MTTATQPAPLTLRPREAAKALGISSRTLWQLTKDGKVPFVQIGGVERRTVVYPVADLQAWLSHQAKANLESRESA